MKYEFLLPKKLLPKEFKYPDSYLEYINLEIPDLDPWHFYYDGLQFAYDGLRQRYPNRVVVPFARRGDNDDVACFDASASVGSLSIIIIHDFATPGWENRGVLKSFDEWVELAKRESDEYKSYT